MGQWRRQLLAARRRRRTRGRGRGGRRCTAVVVLRRAEGAYDMVRLPASEAAEPEQRRADHVLSGLLACSVFSSSAARTGTGRCCSARTSTHAASRRGRCGSRMMTHDVDLAAHTRLLQFLHDGPFNCARLERKAAAANSCGSRTRMLPMSSRTMYAAGDGTGMTPTCLTRR
jgi:hypothetical protein